MKIGSRIIISDPLILKQLGDSVEFTKLRSGIVVAVNGGRSRVGMGCDGAVINKPRALAAAPDDDVMLWRPRFGFSKSVVFAIVKTSDLEMPSLTNSTLRIPIPYASLFMRSDLDKISFSQTSTKMMRAGWLVGRFVPAISDLPSSFSMYPDQGRMETHCMKSMVAKAKAVGVGLGSFKFIRRIGEELHFGQNIQSVC